MRKGYQLAWGIMKYDPTTAQNQNAFANRGQLVDDVSNEEYDLRCAYAEQVLVKSLPLFRVKVVCWLIEEDDVRIMNKSLCDCNALFGTTGKIAYSEDLCNVAG